MADDAETLPARPARPSRPARSSSRAGSVRRDGQQADSARSTSRRRRGLTARSSTSTLPSGRLSMLTGSVDSQAGSRAGSDGRRDHRRAADRPERERLAGLDRLERCQLGRPTRKARSRPQYARCCAVEDPDAAAGRGRHVERGEGIDGGNGEQDRRLRPRAGRRSTGRAGMTLPDHQIVVRRSPPARPGDQGHGSGTAAGTRRWPVGQVGGACSQKTRRPAARRSSSTASADRARSSTSCQTGQPPAPRRLPGVIGGVGRLGRKS